MLDRINSPWWTYFISLKYYSTGSEGDKIQSNERATLQGEYLKGLCQGCRLILYWNYYLVPLLTYKMLL